MDGTLRSARCAGQGLWITLWATKNGPRRGRPAVSLGVVASTIHRDRNGGKRGYGRRVHRWFQSVLRDEEEIRSQVSLARCGRSGAPSASTRSDRGGPLRGWEEKETDVALGAMMVADAASGLAGTTLLISADTDLAPALSAVRMVAPAQRIFLALPPGNTGPSPHLTGGEQVGHFFIRESVLNRAQMPDVVVDSVDGRAYRRPDKWR